MSTFHAYVDAAHFHEALGTKSKVTMSAASHRWTRSSCWSALQLESYAAFCCKGVSQWEKKSQFGILHFLIVVGAIRSVMLHWTFALGK